MTYTHDDAMRDLSRARECIEYLDGPTSAVPRRDAFSDLSACVDLLAAYIVKLEGERDEWQQIARVLAENTTAPFDWTAEERITWAREQVLRNMHNTPPADNTEQVKS